MGSIVLVIAACQGSGAGPTGSSGPTTTPTAPTSEARSTGEDARREQEYRALANDVINGFGQLTRIISNTGIGLAGNPEDAVEVRETVEAVIGSFELSRERLERADAPPGYEEFHRMLQDELSFYTQASAALLPDSETGEADLSRFQELMLQGGKNTHAAGAKLSDLSRAN